MRRDRVERARCALAILCEPIQPERAFLYGMREGQAVLLASLRDQPEPELLSGAVQRYVERELLFEEPCRRRWRATRRPELSTHSS